MKQNVQKNFIYRYDNTYLDCFPTSISYGEKSHTSTKRYIFGISDVDQPHPDSSAVSRPLGSSNFTRSTAILSGFQHIALMKALKEAWIPLLPLALVSSRTSCNDDLTNLGYLWGAPWGWLQNNSIIKWFNRRRMNSYCVDVIIFWQNFTRGVRLNWGIDNTGKK